MQATLRPRSAGILLVAGSVLFGLGSVIVARVSLGAYAVAFWRLAVAAAAFLPLVRLSGQRWPQSRRALAGALLAGVFLAFDLALWHESIRAVGPGISTVLNCLQIFWLTAIGLMLFGETLGRLQLAGLLAAIGGVAMIAVPEFGHNVQAGWGLVSGLLSGVMLAVSMVFVRQTQQAGPVGIFPLMFLISVGGMAALLPISLIWESNRFFPADWTEAGWVIVYGIVMQCLAWGMIAYSIPLLSLALTGLLLLAEPVAALLIDSVFLHKPVSALQWAGAALTMLAIYLGSLKSGAKQEAA